MSARRAKTVTVWTKRRTNAAYTKMQPCFSIHPVRLQQHYEALCALGFASVASDPFTRSALYLTGLRYAFSYFVRSQKGIDPYRFAAPVHPLDDGLREASVRAANALVKKARSRDVSDSIRSCVQIHDKPPLNELWQRLIFAWIGMDRDLPRSVQGWLERQAGEEGWLRLATGMGVISLFGVKDHEFVHELMKRPISYLNPSLNADENSLALKRISAFERDSSTDLPEL